MENDQTTEEIGDTRKSLLLWWKDAVAADDIV